MPTPALLTDFDSQRQTMVDCQIRTFDVTDQAVIARFLDVPREWFVPGPMQSLAYSDAALEIGQGGDRRCMLPPLVLARMIQGAGPQPTDRALDVAGGAGYSGAILAGLTAEVVALESDAALSATAAANFQKLGVNARAVCGPLDASSGVDGAFDLIFVNGAIEQGVERLLSLLKPGGRLLAIEKGVRDPSGKAGKVVRLDKIGREPSRRVLFDASAPVLAPFRAAPSFVF